MVFRVLFMIVISLIAIEFGLHIVYHASTGKGGVNDGAFGYLKELFSVPAKNTKQNTCNTEPIVCDDLRRHKAA